MKPLFLSLLLIIAASHLAAQFTWLESLSSTSQITKEHFLGVCTGPAREVYAAGLSTTGGTTQPVIQSYDQNGNPGFTRLLTSTPSGIAYDIGYDLTTNQLIIGGTQAGSPFLELADPVSGNMIARANISGSGIIKALDVTATHIYVIGNYSGTLNLGTLSVTGGSAFVAQFDLAGTAIQAINITSLNAKGFDVKVDAADNVYFTLSTQSDIFFGTGFPGNYTFSGVDAEEFVLVQANAAFQAQYSRILRRTNFPVSIETEIPLALDEIASLVYVGTPLEPSPVPVDGGIGSFDLGTGNFVAYAPLPNRTVRDLTVSCGELFAVGGAATGFSRTTCTNAGHAAWFQRFGTTLSPGTVESATFCSWSQAIAADDFGHLALAGGYNDASNLTWGGLTTPSLHRGGGMVARVNSGTSCCTSSVERCLDFNGMGQAVALTNSPLSGLAAFTLETWFKFEGASTNAFRTIFLNNGGTVLTMGVRNNGLFVRAGGPPTFGVAPVQTGRWHRLSVTYQGNVLTTFLDGLSVDQRTVSLSLNNEFNVGQLTLTSGNAFSWDGQLDEVAVFDYAKGPAEVLNGLDCKPTGNEDGLILYLSLDQGAPGQPNPGLITAIDLSPSGNDGTLHNFDLMGQTSNWVCSDLILTVCPPDTCGAPLPVNTFSRYREHLDVGSAPTDKELDVTYGAFRMPNGDIVQLGVVAGSDTHNPLYVAKSDDQGNPIGNPDLYHPMQGDEAIQLLHDAPTPIRDATGTLIGFLATGIAKLPGNEQQRVLLRFDLSLNLLDSRFYQPLIPGVREEFSDVIQDSNGDYIAIGQVDQALYNSGFVMRIEPNLNISHYHKLEDFGQDIYPDKIIEADFNFPGMFGGIRSTYLLGGHTLGGDLFVEGLDFNLQPVGTSTGYTVGAPGTGNASQYLAGLDYLPDGRIALTGTSNDGKVWVQLIYGSATTLPTGAYVFDVDNGTEEVYCTALRPGNRLLIGGRAEASGSSNGGAQALLLEVDLNTTVVNWARTYGNANYPESVALDVYADDKGILVSGFGITLTGTTAGGFLGDLNHWDSWLAATDTLGRVYDCDCYETTYAVGTPDTVNPQAWVLLNFSPVTRGQDDLAQDRNKASIVDYYCDQYLSSGGTPCAGGSDANRDNLANGTSITVAGGTWTLANSLLPNGFELTVDWGDGAVQTVPANQLPLQHTYTTVGTYSICIDYVVYAADGTVCWQRNDCNSITTATREERQAPVISLSAYPNPTHDVVYFQYGPEHGIPAATVFSASGQRVRMEPRLTHGQLSLAGLPSGVYVVQLRFPDGARARQRVILR